MLKKILKRKVKKTEEYEIKPEFTSPLFANSTIQKLIEDYTFDTVLDIGAGSMEHSILFSNFGKQVTAVDFGISIYYKEFKAERGH